MSERVFRGKLASVTAVVEDSDSGNSTRCYIREPQNIALKIGVYGEGSVGSMERFRRVKVGVSEGTTCETRVAPVPERVRSSFSSLWESRCHLQLRGEDRAEERGFLRRRRGFFVQVCKTERWRMIAAATPHGPVVDVAGARGGKNGPKWIRNALAVCAVRLRLSPIILYDICPQNTVL